MRAAIGDRIVIKGHRVGEPDHGAELLGIRGLDGTPPYLVRWGDTGHQALLFPGTDADIQTSST